jgi:hypothetical protein
VVAARYVSTAGGGHNARSVVVVVYTSTAGRVVDARSVVAAIYLSMDIMGVPLLGLGA